MRISRPVVAVATVLGILTCGAWPGGPGHESLAAPHVATATPTGAARHFGKSIGSPNEGKLVGGARLEESPYLRVVPGYTAGDVRWGLEPLVQALDRAARAVRRQFPDAVTSVGHLSRAGGGDIGRHHSHESGRDADVLFFIKNKANHAVLPERFVSFKGDGSSMHVAGLTFDDMRNWTFVHSLLTDPARVTHIFVSAPLRARLLAVADRLHTPADLRRHAEEVMVQPRGSLPHDDHFHVRIGCPANMHECVENPTMHLASRAHPRVGGGHHHAQGPRTAPHAPTARHDTKRLDSGSARSAAHDPYAEAPRGSLEIEIGRPEERAPGASMNAIVGDDPDGT